MIQQKLPLMVMYESGDSWYIKDDKPVAIFLKPDEIACYAYNLPKMPYGQAKRLCEEMDVANFFWQIPNNKQLQTLLDVWPLLEKTASMINANGLHRSRYWGRYKVDDEKRLGLNLALEREEELHVYQFAYLRPFMIL